MMPIKIAFYPVTPATDQYVIGAPLFKKIILRPENGKPITITAPGNSAANRYVSSITVNGKPWSKNWFSHAELVKGAVVNFNMTAAPVKTRGINPADFPYSLSNDKNAVTKK